MEDALERHRSAHYQETRKWVETEVKFEEYLMDDAQYLIVSYGSAARICRDAVDILRAEGYKVGLFRPITLFPFPELQIAAFKQRGIRAVLTSEMAMPPMFHKDVRYHLDGEIPCTYYNRCGGNLVDEHEAVEAMKTLIEEVR